jgi:hypothetical protein
MLFELTSFVGRHKTARRIGAAGTDWTDDDTTKWGIGFKGYIPIISEKKNNKAGALSFHGQAFLMQGATGSYYTVTDSYIFPSSVDAAGDFDARNPTWAGGWCELSYYLTNNVYVNAIYGTTSINWSEPAKANANTTSASSFRSIQHYIVNLMYDVNPAIRLGIEYTHVTTGYTRAQAAGSGGASGSLDVGRLAAWYFF